MKPQRDINNALAFAVFGWLFTAILWALSFRARTTVDGARSYIVFGALIGIAMNLTAWQFEEKGMKKSPRDKDRGTARVVRILVALHVLVAVVVGAILLVLS